MDNPLQRILCVDDAEDIQKVIKLSLESLGGFTLKICSSGTEALDSVVGYAPDLIILDVMMPDMDGPATLKALRKLNELEKVPIIFMTGNCSPEEVEQLMNFGAAEVVKKPFNPVKLPDQIKEIWESL